MWHCLWSVVFVKQTFSSSNLPNIKCVDCELTSPSPLKHDHLHVTKQPGCQILSACRPLALCAVVWIGVYGVPEINILWCHRKDRKYIDLIYKYSRVGTGVTFTFWVIVGRSSRMAHACLMAVLWVTSQSVDRCRNRLCRKRTEKGDQKGHWTGAERVKLIWIAGQYCFSIISSYWK